MENILYKTAHWIKLARLNGYSCSSNWRNEPRPVVTFLALDTQRLKAAATGGDASLCASSRATLPDISSRLTHICAQ
eukprot:810499-Amphidinium_carterae.1